MIIAASLCDYSSVLGHSVPLYKDLHHHHHHHHHHQQQQQQRASDCRRYIMTVRIGVARILSAGVHFFAQKS